MQFIADRIASGRYGFSSDEAAHAFATSAVATGATLRRLRQKGEVAMPYKGSYVVVSPEFRIAWMFGVKTEIRFTFFQF